MTTEIKQQYDSALEEFQKKYKDFNKKKELFIDLELSIYYMDGIILNHADDIKVTDMITKIKHREMTYDLSLVIAKGSTNYIIKTIMTAT